MAQERIPSGTALGLRVPGQQIVYLTPITIESGPVGDAFGKLIWYLSLDSLWGQGTGTGLLHTGQQAGMLVE